MTTVLRTVILLGLAGFLCWTVVGGIRRGSYPIRGGYTVRRHKSPIQFWLGILIAGCVCILSFIKAIQVASHG
jgi:hypothetical protein